MVSVHSMLAEKLNMTPEDAERWIVNLIRNARLDAKIDSKLVNMTIYIPRSVFPAPLIRKSHVSAQVRNSFSRKELRKYSSEQKKCPLLLSVIIREPCNAKQ